MEKEEIKQRREVKVRRKLKKKRLTIIVTLVVLIFGTSIFLFVSNKKMIKDINSHYNKTIIVTKNTKLYDKNKKEVGDVHKNTIFTLKNTKINHAKEQYFQIKGTDYYLYYTDVKKTKKQEQEAINPNYLTFNKNIETQKNTIFYQNKKERVKLNKKISLPILYMDTDYYYVDYLSNIFQIKKTEKDILVDKENTKEKEAEYISVIHYEKIEEQCNDYICVPTNNVKEQLNHLKDSGYYSITQEEYKKYLEGNIRLKEKAILITTGNQTDIVNNINKEYKLQIELVNNESELRFTSTNKKSTKETSKESIDRYQIKSITTIDNFKKMVSGEEVIENIPKPANSSKEQSIAVLNYHFFYDGSSGEECNEGICLDVKNFREQLNYLKENGYKTLKMSEFKRWMYGEIELPEKSVLITVDDGAKGTGAHNGNRLIPLLEEYNMNATLFLISGWWSVENYRSPHLDIQSHTYDMHNYGDCGKGQVVCANHDQLLEDLKKSLTIVDNNDSFCFPFYSFSDLSIQVVQEAGFKLAFIGGNRKAKRSDNKFMVPRYPIYKTTSLSQFINMVS